MSKTYYRVPLVLAPQPEGGFTVTSPALPELVTEGDTVEEAIENARDALAATIEIYEDDGRPLPPELCVSSPANPIEFDYLVTVP
ncbi:MAG: type II toxin-antitoxin system HicB family antitoxin [Planctomycetes bacterium]|nr:type II toxin-antitoxin system HicB family antitoxin [Planctomycetota bacterium]